MAIDWASFTPWTALIGGVIVGLAAAMLVLLNGRVAGISGIVGGLLRPSFPDLTWRAAFVAGLRPCRFLPGSGARGRWGSSQYLRRQASRDA
jgi:uncharacterized membrane protein YedE/YeeE